MPNYPIDPKGWSRLVKPKNKIGTFPIGDELTGFESMIPGQAAVSEELYNALLNALQGQFPEEYFSTAIAGPLRRTFEQETAPAIREEFVGPGTYWGTARATEVGRGRTRMEEDVSAKRATLAYQTQRQALEAALAYLGIPLMAAYQPFDEGEGATNDINALLAALKKRTALGPTTQLVAGPGPAIPGGPTYQASLLRR